MLVKFRKRTQIGSTVYAHESEADLDNGTADQVIRMGLAYRIGSGERSVEAAFAFNSVGGVSGVLDPDGNIITGRVHPYYHFHGFAGNQAAGDGKFFDLSGINHGVRGNDLSDTQMFATPGYVSTVDPTSGATNSVIRIPAVDFDYNGGEKLIVWWLGKAVAEGSQQHVIGDGYSTSVKGWGITSTAAGKLQIILSGATQGYSGSSATTLFDGTLHSFGVVLDGQDRRYSVWSDDVLDSNFSAGYLSYGSGADFDVKTTNTVNIGSASPSPGGTAGIATATRALVILRLPTSYTLPDVASFTELFKQLRANPGKLILASAF